MCTVPDTMLRRSSSRVGRTLDVQYARVVSAGAWSKTGDTTIPEPPVLPLRLNVNVCAEGLDTPIIACSSQQTMLLSDKAGCHSSRWPLH